MQITIVIPTFEREGVLLDTISSLLELEPQPNEIVVVDQTPEHEDRTRVQLAAWHGSGEIRWIRLDQPSITAAMNLGLCKSKSELVLFLDDDIVPQPDLLKAHERMHSQTPDLWATVGQVIQPWQTPSALTAPRKLNGLMKDFDFPFHSTIDADVGNVMAGNLCVKRERALSIGGFDENFIGAAYRFETDFARRIVKAGGRIRFVGSAGIDHLRVKSGGTRSKGNHMTSASPLHGFGDYYYAFRYGSNNEAWTYSARRFFREVRTKFHLTHPWWIPVKMIGEARAMLMARRAIRSGQKLINPGSSV